MPLHVRRGLHPVAICLAAMAVAASPARAQEQAPAPADSAGRAYELSQVEAMPELANRAKAAQAVRRFYPREQRSRGEQGVVTLRFLIQADGQVDSASVTVQTTTSEAFAEPAANVVRTMRFTPGRVGRRAVPVWVILPVLFSPDAG